MIRGIAKASIHVSTNLHGCWLFYQYEALKRLLEHF
jgi:hypothetical protein